MTRRWDMLVHGVYLVTTATGEERAGLTAAFAAQLSPDALIVALGAQSYTAELIRDSGVLAITVLGEDQLELATAWGTQSSRHGDKFAGLPLRTIETGCPVITSGLLALDCRVESVLDESLTRGKLFVCRIVAGERFREGAPLVFHQDDYLSF
ncbi:MAG: flavin reductase [Fimbriimonadaceae bacterium]|nr:flavin reductase [Fimbriimonadaceae bacterium]